MSLPDDLPQLRFASADAFGAWIAEHHATAAGLWLEVPKKGKGGTGPTYVEALDHALCWGWIDSQKRGHDDVYFLQRFTPRKARSKWSQINRDKVTALIAAGRMQPTGQAEIDAAKADGRWDAAYAGSATITIPDDLRSALDATPGAAEGFAALNASQRYAVLFQVHDAKRAATRERRIAKYVAMCAKGETPG